jgi:hypothetical protein
MNSLPHTPIINKFHFFGTAANQAQKMLLLVAFIAIAQVNLLAGGPGEESWTNWLYGPQLANGASFSVQDDRYGNTTLMQGVSGHLYVRDVVWLEVNEDTLMMKPNVTNFELLMGVAITRWDSAQVAQTTSNVTLSVKYDKTEGVTSRLLDYYEFTGSSKIQVTINANSITYKENGVDVTTTKFAANKGLFRLYGKVIVQRKYKNLNFCTAVPAFNNTLCTIDATYGTLVLNWQPVVGAEEYDVEWAFHDSLSEQLTLGLNYIPPAGGDYDFLFKNNASRVTVGGTTYSIPLIYPAGKIFYRVRAARYTFNGQKRENGIWSSLKGTSSWTVNAYPDQKVATWHERKLNWQAQAIFVEDGLRSQSIRYFDGSLRERQSVAMSEDNAIAIASETVYDNQGRPALKVMPAPNSSNSTTWIRRLSYNNRFISDNTGGVYDKADFDTNNSCSGAVAGQVSSASSAVGRYYSSSNIDANAPTFDKYIPSAGGYPFAITEFTPDQTGRIKRQGGVGSNFQLGSGHEPNICMANLHKRSWIASLAMK